MLINNIIKLAIIVCSVVTAYIETSAAQDFTIDQYFGLWYDVGVIHRNIIETSLIPCEWRDVTVSGEKSANEAFTFIFRERPIIFQGNVTLANSKLHIRYSHSTGGTFVYEVRSYNNGDDLILLDDRDKIDSILVSRHIVASEEATEYFEEIAADVGGYVEYIENKNCF